MFSTTVSMSYGDTQFTDCRVPDATVSNGPAFTEVHGPPHTVFYASRSTVMSRDQLSTSWVCTKFLWYYGHQYELLSINPVAFRLYLPIYGNPGAG